MTPNEFSASPLSKVFPCTSTDADEIHPVCLYVVRTKESIKTQINFADKTPVPIGYIAAMDLCRALCAASPIGAKETMEMITKSVLSYREGS